MLLVLSFILVEPTLADPGFTADCVTSGASFVEKVIPEDPSMFAITGVQYHDQHAFCEVQVEAYLSGNLQFVLTSAQGEILFSNQQQLEEGINNVGFAFGSYPTGVYLLEMNLVGKEKILVIEKIANGQIKASLVQP